MFSLILIIRPILTSCRSRCFPNKYSVFSSHLKRGLKRFIRLNLLTLLTISPTLSNVEKRKANKLRRFKTRILLRIWKLFTVIQWKFWGIRKIETNFQNFMILFDQTKWSDIGGNLAVKRWIFCGKKCIRVRIAEFFFAFINKDWSFHKEWV